MADLEEKNVTEEEEVLPLSLETIPVEVLLQIFNFVDATDLLRNVSLVSKYFHSILSNEMTWKIKMEKRWGATGDRKFPPIDLLPDDEEEPPQPEPSDSTPSPPHPPHHSYSNFTPSRFPWSKACVKREEQIKLWNPTENTTLPFAELKSHIGCIDSVHLFKHNNEILLICGSRDRNMSLWNVNNALDATSETDASRIKILYRAHEGWIWDFAVNSNSLFSCSWDTTAKIWDLNTLQPTATFKSNTALLSISTTNTFTAIGGFNRKILLLDPRTPQTPTSTISTHTKSVLSVGLDSTSVISCGEDGLVSRHDLRTNKLSSQFKLVTKNTRTQYPTCMSFRETNLNVPYFYIGDNIGNVHLVELLNFKIACSTNLHDNSPVRGVFNNLGTVVSCSRQGRLVVSSSCLGLSELRTVDVGKNIELPCVHSLDNVVACGGGDGTVRIWGSTTTVL